jgi:hypothetical protein
MNSGKGKAILTTYETMEAWTPSRNGIHLPKLSDKLFLDTEMGEMVISLSKMSESQPIRDSSFTKGCFSVTEVMIGSMDALKNTWKREEMACNWCIVELQLNEGGHAKFQMV